MSKRVAERWERELRQSLLDGSHGKKEVKRPPTVTEFEKEFMSNFVEANNKPSTISTKRTILNSAIVPFFGAMHLDEIDVRQIERFKRRLIDQGLKAKSINNYLSVLRRLLSVAVEWKVDRAGPAGEMAEDP